MARTLSDRPEVTAVWLAGQLTDPTAPGIASGVHRLVRARRIEPGSRLPTVRSLANRLSVSPATVSAAWAILRRQRLIEGTGRQGTWISDGPIRLMPNRFDSTVPTASPSLLDLSRAEPDPDLLPDLAAAIAQSDHDVDLNSYVRQEITPSLEHAVRAQWPWPAEKMVAVNGGYDGLLTVLRAVVVPGDYVAVADPSTSRILDILDEVGVRPIPVATDAEGPTVRSLDRALDKAPGVFLYEPRSSSRTGASITEARRRALVTRLRRGATLLIEDDGLGELSASPYFGLGPVFPHRTVLIRSYSKSHGPDLRLAVMAGPSSTITNAHELRQYGDGWSSRITQNALAQMLTDPATRELVAHARSVYRQRRTEVIALFAEPGIILRVPDGLALNIPVRNERSALLSLAAQGIATAGSSRGGIRILSPSVRFGIGRRIEDLPAVVDAYVHAARQSRVPS